MKNKIIIYGVITGVLATIYTMVFYFQDKSLILNPYVLASSSIIHIIFMSKVAMDTRIELNFKMTFKDAIKPAFGVYVVASITFFIFLYCLYNFIDPELTTIWWEIGKENGYSEHIEDYKVTISHTIFGIFRSFIFGFMLAVGVSAILKTE